MTTTTTHSPAACACGICAGDTPRPADFDCPACGELILDCACVTVNRRAPRVTRHHRVRHGHARYIARGSR